ncbi:unnamed protein product [Acanthoscelides obtectus]|uniref:Uncharacterized protein n=1 Tax=Acanthoscelides obtectus TaxID=200917 RepID=A0A9P0P728_ACAOB|nr:unnamed protein product [Acanthoscelides obtectus]CAK1654252.1 hypothetical protein AOBTE_LOCUS18493 [Acanthoscelides obtectus]
MDAPNDRTPTRWQRTELNKNYKNCSPSRPKASKEKISKTSILETSSSELQRHLLGGLKSTLEPQRQIGDSKGDVSIQIQDKCAI